MEGGEKFASTRLRVLIPNTNRRCGESAISSRQALAKACGSLGGTILPVSPTSSAESPTSVTTQGTPHAIASATELDVPSPYADDEQAMSNPAVMRPTSSLSPSRWK